MFGRQIALRMKGECLLRAHHDRVDEASHQHDEAEESVHNADVLVVDAGDPLLPDVRQPAFHDDKDENSEQDQHDHRARSQRDRLVEGNGVPPELAEHYGAPPLTGPSPGPNWRDATASKSDASTPRYVYGTAARLCLKS